jgi:hypothetical protein
MMSRKSTVVFLALMAAPVDAMAQTPSTAQAVAADRPLGHQVFLGVGATWAESYRFEGSVHPGAMLGFDLALGRHVAVGLLGDFTYIDPRPQAPPVSPNYRLIVGLDLKVLPLGRGVFRPWLTAGLAGSVVNETGIGWGFGAGAFFLPDLPVAFFVDLRRHQFVDMELPEFEQVTLRAGVSF